MDIEAQWIPDRCSWGALVAGVLLSGCLPELHGAEDRLEGLLSGVIGATAGSGLLFLIGVIGSALLKREAMGLGDVKLMGGIGAFLGWKAIFFCLFFASLSALVVCLIGYLLRRGRFTHEIPFGPYLSVAAIVWIWKGSAWWDLYLRWVSGV